MTAAADEKLTRSSLSFPSPVICAAVKSGSSNNQPLSGVVFEPFEEDVAQQFGVQAMPTIVLLKQGKEVERVVGAKKDELEKKILNHRAAPRFAA